MAGTIDHAVERKHDEKVVEDAAKKGKATDAEAVEKDVVAAKKDTPDFEHGGPSADTPDKKEPQR